MTNSTLLDWSKYDATVESLEEKLEILLSDEPYSSDDRRLAHLYIGIARLVDDRMDAQLLEYLSLAENYRSTGLFPKALAGVSNQLGVAANDLDYKEVKGQKSDRPFIYRLMESVTKERFRIFPTTDVEPIGRAVAAGVPSSKIFGLVRSIYPELRFDDGIRLGPTVKSGD